MPTYRIYRLDGAGRISGGDWIEAGSDDAAVADARQRSDSARFELWQGGRLVARLPEDVSVAVMPPSRLEP